MTDIMRYLDIRRGRFFSLTKLTKQKKGSGATLRFKRLKASLVIK